MYRQVHTFFSWNFYGLFIELCEHRVADLVHIADYAVGAVVKYRSVRVGVDGDDGVRVRKARDMVHGAGDTEGNVQLRLYDNTRLADNELKRQNTAVKHRPRAGKLAAETLGKAAIARQSVRALYRVSYADYNVGIGYIQALVHAVCAEVEDPCAYVLNGEVDVLLNDLAFMRAGRRALESAGSDCSDLRTRHGNCYNCHHLAADGGLDELNIRSFRVPDKLGCVRCAARAETCGKARSKVAAVYRSADHDSRRPVFFAQNGEQVCVRVVVEIIVSRAIYANELNMIRLIEDRNYFFFFAAPQLAYIVEKKTLDPNDVDKFRAYTSRRIGLEWTRSRPWYSVNIKGLINDKKNTRKIPKH